MKVCNNCDFRIPEWEYKAFGACGQCGVDDYKEIKEVKDEKIYN